ncbi:response regulator transcription factor [Lederbergia citri]|uniref:Helix-turn-helix domain-containing protein n=1 Tax=Lederbergia citri TaxID=2833580 RepID=A0A942TID4_9BACI|nr:helix-turn-helix domain-containing protein [Lederbergia citri]MBS4196899.1 helix-turn-helix domain-containing protein [Lederbergia citri]
MKILIVDDEELISISLKNMLQQYSIKLIDEVKNGDNIIEKIKKIQPSLAFINIDMLDLNWLKVLENGRMVSPFTQWIFLSRFFDFNSARKAIELKASSLLLKPVSPEDLNNSIKKAINDYKQLLTNINREFDYSLVSYFCGLSYPKDIICDKIYLNSVIVIDSHLAGNEKKERIIAFCSSLERIIEGMQTSDTRFSFFSLSDNALALVTAWDLKANQHAENTISMFMQIVEKLILFNSVDNFYLTMISALPSKLEDMKRLFREMGELASLRVVAGIRRKWCLSELRDLKQIEELYQISTSLINLSKYSNQKSTLNYIKALDEIEILLSKVDFKEISDHLTNYLNSVFPYKLYNDNTPENLLSYLKTSGEKLLSLNHKEEDRSQWIVDEVINHVNKNFMKDIGIGQLARELHVTPNYLSTLFHRKTGITFTKYLTKIRISKAKELLTDPHIKVQQVAKNVGYYSTRHFTRVFTELTGCYPSEYHKKSNHINIG